jgi:hypothetical protein
MPVNNPKRTSGPMVVVSSYRAGELSTNERHSIDISLQSPAKREIRLPLSKGAGLIINDYGYAYASVAESPNSAPAIQ